MTRCSAIVCGVFALAALLCVFSGHGSAAWAQDDVGSRAASVSQTETVRLWQAPGPPQWGKNVPGSAGELKFVVEPEGAFVATIKLSGLGQRKAYMLCLNGREGGDGNKELLTFGRSGEEGKYDFKTVTTDMFGTVAADLTVKLPPSRYSAKFFVKAIGDNYACVLHNDDVRFEVK